MARILSVALSVFFLSACATVTENNETPVAEPQSAPTSEMQAVEPSVPEAVEPPKNELVRVPKIPSTQKIMLFQTQLKAAGFNPGPVDGALGARTLIALRELQSGCSNLEDLLENPSSAIAARSEDEIRLLQVRLKENATSRITQTLIKEESVEIYIVVDQAPASSLFGASSCAAKCLEGIK
jgi:hypothetical protein